MDSGDAKGAEVVLRASLLDFTESAHAMWGLRESLLAQQSHVQDQGGIGADVVAGNAELAELEKRINSAWSHADVNLLASCPAFMTGRYSRGVRRLSSCPNVQDHGSTQLTLATAPQALSASAAD